MNFILVNIYYRNIDWEIGQDKDSEIKFSGTFKSDAEPDIIEKDIQELIMTNKLDGVTIQRNTFGNISIIDIFLHNCELYIHDFQYIPQFLNEKYVAVLDLEGDFLLADNHSILLQVDHFDENTIEEIHQVLDECKAEYEVINTYSYIYEQGLSDIGASILLGIGTNLATDLIKVISKKIKNKIKDKNYHRSSVTMINPGKLIERVCEFTKLNPHNTSITSLKESEDRTYLLTLRNRNKKVKVTCDKEGNIIELETID